ncbi:MAG: hypothetical protein P4M07_17965 [Xanthobacteraceae bacterium]|nr:hypothetical protein [Xanthobacteraceae bacterium]
MQLVEELIRYGGVPPSDATTLGVMTDYPPGAHWIAALVAPLAGSGLVAMTWVAIAAILVCYVMLFWLSQRELAIAAAAALGICIFCLAGLRSQVGWEVSGSFFYPQLVADVFFFGFLCWLAVVKDPIGSGSLALPLWGAGLMYVHPLVAMQAMGAGLGAMLSITLMQWRANRYLSSRSLLAIGAATCASLVIIGVHPAFGVMRLIANWNGGTNIAISHVSFILLPGLGAVAVLLWLCLSGRGSRTDAIIGGALASSIALLILQDIAWLWLGQGSPYAVKKHLFVLTSVLAVSVARLAGRALTAWWKSIPSDLITMGAALTVTIWVVAPLLTPAKIVLEPLQYAATIASQPGFRPASIAADDQIGTPLTNVIVALVGFRFPNNSETFGAYFSGARPETLSSRLMIRRTPDLDRSCPEQFDQTATFAVVSADCLHRYIIGTVISFASDGGGGRYLTNGWSGAEPWGRWSEGMDGGKLRITTEHLPGALQLRAEAIALVGANGLRDFHVSVNGSEVALWRFSPGIGNNPFTAMIPGELIADGKIEIAFVPDRVVIPGGHDLRELGIGIKSLSLARIATPSRD